MGGQQLLDIQREARREAEAERGRPPVACECGEPLKRGANGVLYCGFCGTRYPGS